jgi:hypothetical protein
MISENVLVQNYSFILSNEMKIQLSISIGFQLLRGKHRRDFQRNNYLDIARTIVQKLQNLDVQLDDDMEAQEVELD